MTFLVSSSDIGLLSKFRVLGLISGRFTLRIILSEVGWGLFLSSEIIERFIIIWEFIHNFLRIIEFLPRNMGGSICAFYFYFVTVAIWEAINLPALFP